MTFHKRSSPVHSHKFARAPAGARGLYPRFTPTAIWPGELSDDLPATSTTPDRTAPVPVTTTTSLPPKVPVTSPPLNPPVTRPAPTTPAPAPVIPQTTSTIPLPVTTTPINAPSPQPTLSVQITPSLVLTAVVTSSLGLPPLPTTTLNGQASISSLTSFATRSIASAVVSGSSLSTASESATSTSAPSGASTGAVIGGIAAGLAGVAAVVLGVFFLVRRWRKRSDENTFSADHFRRSAVLLDDPPTHEDTVNRGYNPRPPSMIERKVASTPAPYSTYGGQHTAYGATGYNSYGSYGPGDVFSPPPSAASPDPFYPYNSNPVRYNAVSPYAQTPFSPASPMSPYASPHDAPYPHAAGVVAGGAMSSGLTGHTAQVGRQASLAAPNSLHPGHASVTTVGSVPTSDYVDLTRSSVSPYQAAQYVEISKQLNSDVPVGLTTPDMNQYTSTQVTSSGKDTSPFADPQRFSTQLPSPYDQTPHSPTELNLPAPPPAVAVASAHARVGSHPPLLPEIHVQPRVSGYDEFPANQNKFPVSPSPLASSFSVASPPATQSEFTSPSAADVVAQPQQLAAAAPPKAPDVPLAPIPRAQAPSPDTTKRPPTVYDEGDAYGGF